MKSIVNYILEQKFSRLMNHRYDDEVKSVIWDYVAGYITNVNDELRKCRNPKEVTELLDKGFTKKTKINLYRTVSWDYLKNIYGLTRENIKEHIGDVITNKGYMSASSEYRSPWDDKWTKDEVILHLTSDSQYPCIDVNEMFSESEIDCYFQKEIILPRDTKLRIDSVSMKNDKSFYKDGNYYIEMNII